MRLYPRQGTTALTVDGMVYELDEETGAFELPEHIAAAQHRIHIDGQPMFENEEQRTDRLRAEEHERLRDPMTQSLALQQMAEEMGELRTQLAEARAPKSRSKPKAT